MAGHQVKEGDMKFLVAYNGSDESKAALHLAREHALVFGAKVYVMTSMEGGVREKIQEIQKTVSDLEYAQNFMAEKDIVCEVRQMVRGLAPGEDLVRFAKEEEIDHIFVGIEKKSKTQKILLGSTSQYIILKASCPVTTIK
jgi:nucleotide-binding universal stress UspA family protein